MSLHPLFKEITETIVDSQGRACHPVQVFDEFDDDLMHDLIGNKRLAKPVQTLLVTLWQMEATGASFGLDPVRALEMVKKELTALRNACKEEYEENL